MSKISEFFTPDMMMAVGFFIVGHALGWFAGNAQFVWEFWKDKPVLATVLMGTPAGLCFWWGTNDFRANKDSHNHGHSLG